jgi:hypothetical protein
LRPASAACRYATGCTGTGSTTAFPDQSGELAETAQVNVDFDCGTLKVGRRRWLLVEPDRSGQRRPRPRVTSTTGQVSVDRDDSSGFPGSGRSNWNMTIPRDSNVSLGLTLNAGDGNGRPDGSHGELRDAHGSMRASST